MRRCLVTCSLDDITTEQAAIADRVFVAALAEVGHPAMVIDLDRCGHPIFALEEDPVHHKARSLAYTAAGLPFEWIE